MAPAYEKMPALDERDRYLIEAARFYPGASDREAARQLRSALRHIVLVVGVVIKAKRRVHRSMRAS